MNRIVVAVAALLVGGCASTPDSHDMPQPSAVPEAEREAPVVAPAPPAKGGYYLDDGPGDRKPEDFLSIPDAEPRAEPLHRWANRPYKVFGRDYVPLARLQPFRQRGSASWYGRRFHGQKTASGEVYDMYAMTAAHTTLPIPSYVRVTHTGNGRSVVVRVNDRGPFHPGRIIDLSYAAAAKLGFVHAGSAEVEVETLLTQDAEGAADSTEARGLYLQVGAFSARENAEGLRTRLAQELAWLQETARLLLVGDLWRLQIGPYRSHDDARSVAERIEAQLRLKPLVIAR